MALKPCPCCGNYISDKATKCPKCGIYLTPLNNEEVINKVSSTDENGITPSSSNTGVDIDPSSQNYYINEENYNHRKFLKWSVVVIVVLLISGVVGYYFYAKNGIEKERIEKHRQDSIAEIQRELAVLEQIRQDSIEFEKSQSLLADIWLINGQPSMKKNWKTNILNLGFKEGEKVNKGIVAGEYEDELFEIYYIPFTRILNGRRIEIRESTERLIRSQTGEYVNEDEISSGLITILFDSKNDYDNFRESLYSLGMKYKEGEGYGIWDDFDSEYIYRNGGDIVIKFYEKGNYIVKLYYRSHQD